MLTKQFPRPIDPALIEQAKKSADAICAQPLIGGGIVSGGRSGPATVFLNELNRLKNNSPSHDAHRLVR